MDKIEMIEKLQAELRIPDCFVLCNEKLMSDATICELVHRITTNTLRAGDQFALLEIIKDWLAYTEKHTTAEEKSEFPITLNPPKAWEKAMSNSPES